jgi:Rod binding domain-containing protein
MRYVLAPALLCSKDGTTIDAGQITMKITPLENSQPNQLSVANSAEARKAAKEFESLFVSFMVKAMRSTVGENPLLPPSFGEKVYTDMLDTEYSNQISEHGGLGLADMILKQIDKENGSSPLSALQALKPNSWMLDNRLVPGRQSAVSDATSVSMNLDRFNSIIQEASKAYNIDPNLVSAVIARESGGNPAAVSSAGAKGLMQLMDSTAQDLGTGNVWDPHANIMSGTRYLRSLLDRFGGDEKLALASYNAGPAAVERYQGVPPYPETQDYVGAVQNLKRSFAALNDINKDVTNESSRQ